MEEWSHAAWDVTWRSEGSKSTLNVKGELGRYNLFWPATGMYVLSTKWHSEKIAPRCLGAGEASASWQLNQYALRLARSSVVPTPGQVGPASFPSSIRLLRIPFFFVLPYFSPSFFLSFFSIHSWFHPLGWRELSLNFLFRSRRHFQSPTSNVVVGRKRK